MAQIVSAITTAKIKYKSHIAIARKTRSVSVQPHCGHVISRAPTDCQQARQWDVCMDTEFRLPRKKPVWPGQRITLATCRHRSNFGGSHCLYYSSNSLIVPTDSAATHWHFEFELLSPLDLWLQAMRLFCNRITIAHLTSPATPHRTPFPSQSICRLSHSLCRGR